MKSFLEGAQSLTRPDPGAGPLRFSSVIVCEVPVIRLGLDVSGNYALLIEIESSPAMKNTLQLEHLVVQYGIECTVTDVSGGKSDARVVLIRLQNATTGLRHYFLEIAEILTRSLAGATDVGRIEEAVVTLVELFRKLSQPSKRSVQGLWGELLLIDQSASPEKILTAWRAEPQQRYDFSSGLDRIEVKTAGSRARSHHFSAEQLAPPLGSRLLIASMFCERVGQGTTMRDLVTRIRQRVQNVDLLIKLEKVVAETLGSSLEAGLSVPFDYELAKTSLRFYDFRRVPALQEVPPPGVTEIGFRSNLEIVTPLSKGELLSLQGLYVEFV
jgi:hypothetical protein